IRSAKSTSSFVVVSFNITQADPGYPVNRVFFKRAIIQSITFGGDLEDESQRTGKKVSPLETTYRHLTDAPCEGRDQHTESQIETSPTYRVKEEANQYETRTKAAQRQQAQRNCRNHEPAPKYSRKRPQCSYCNNKEHDVSMCPAVRRLDLRCTRLLTTLTEEQIQKVQEMVDSMLKEESKLDERNKDSPVSVNSPCISIPVVPSNLESDKLEPGKEVKNEKSNLEDSLEGILSVYDTLPWKVDWEKTEQREDHPSNTIQDLLNGNILHVSLHRAYVADLGPSLILNNGQNTQKN
ncbi:17490_t:CDS:2, partial [Cetraspora pellucida]